MFCQTKHFESELWNTITILYPQDIRDSFKLWNSCAVIIGGQE
jgi:hypothetical protein